MNKNALEEKRRETVIGLLKGMQVSKDGNDGFDKTDVYNCVQELVNLYEGHIDELESNYESEINELTKKYQKYDENNDLYVSLIMDAKKNSQEIIEQAQSEVDQILRNGKEQIELQEKQMEQFRIDSEKEKEAITAEVEMLKEAAEAEKAAINVETEVEKERLEAIKNKYRQQITAMEDEFSDIRTNILRASSKLDSLKVQAEEIEPEPEWNVSSEEESVQIPEVADAVENVLDIDNKPQEPISFEETFFKSEILENIEAKSADAVKAIEVEQPAKTEEVEAVEIPEAVSTPELAESDAVVLDTVEIEAPAVDDALDFASIFDDLDRKKEADEATINMEDSIIIEEPESINEPENVDIAPEVGPIEEAISVEEIGIPEEAVETIAEPAVEIVEEPVVEIEEPIAETTEETAIEAEDDIDSLLEEISFDGLFDEDGNAVAEVPDVEEISIDAIDEITEDAIEEIDIEEIAIDDIEADGVAIEIEDAVEPVAEVADNGIIEEISFDALEALFKDEQ